MADIEIQFGVQDDTRSVEVVGVTPTTIAANMVLKNAFGNKNNSLHILVTATTAGNLVIKAGNNYPNKVLGDLKVTCAANKVTDIILEDISRFENRDGSVKMDKDTTLAGTIAVVAKRAGLDPQYTNIYNTDKDY